MHSTQDEAFARMYSMFTMVLDGEVPCVLSE